LPFRLDGAGDGAFLRDQPGLQSGKLIAHRGIVRFGIACRAAQGRERRVKFGEAVGCLELGCLGSAFAARNEPVPAAQMPGTGNKPFAWRQRAAIVLVDAMHQREPCGEFRRAI
jgi:hypothetical protein